MITHALARNLVVPFFLGLNIIQIYSNRDMEKTYNFFSKISLLLLPTYLFMIFLGYNPIQWFITETWTSKYSAIQYLTYIPLANSQTYGNTGKRSLSLTLAVISVAAAGYLYEGPRWFMRGGVLELIRTAKTSFIVFDFGMIAFIYMICLGYVYGVKVDKKLVFGSILYVSYCLGYTLFYPEPYISLYYLTYIPMTIIKRIPSMIFCYILSNNICFNDKEKHVSEQDNE